MTRMAGSSAPDARPAAIGIAIAATAVFDASSLSSTVPSGHHEQHEERRSALEARHLLAEPLR